MLLTHEDVVSLAAQTGRGLTDTERLALGVELIKTVHDPRSFLALQIAYSEVGSHRDRLFHAAYSDDAPSIHIETPVDTITHGQSFDRASGPRAGRARAAWKHIVAAERRFSESWAGDLVGGVCVAIFGITVVICLGVLG